MRSRTLCVLAGKTFNPFFFGDFQMRPRTLCVLAIVALVACAVTSTASATVLLYDDFLTSPLDTTKWTESGNGTNTVSGSILTMTAGAVSDNIVSKATFTAAQDVTVTYTLGGPWTRAGENDHGLGFDGGLSSHNPSIQIQDTHSWQHLTLAVNDGWNATEYVDTGIVESSMVLGDKLSIEWSTAAGGTATMYYNGTPEGSISGHGMAGMALLMGIWDTSMTIDSVSVTTTPEPGALVLLGTGLLGLLAYAWRKRK